MTREIRTTQQQQPSRVLATVGFVTWVPSTAGRVNTTDKHIGHVQVWVNHPLDERYPLEERGGEQAITIAKDRLAARGVEWLGLVGLNVDMQQEEKSIVNQPKCDGAEYSADLGIVKLVQ